MRRILVGASPHSLGSAQCCSPSCRSASYLADGDFTIIIHCKPPIVSAWSRGEKRLVLWATTFEDGSNGATVRSGEEPFCGEKARPRLGIALALVVSGGAAIASRRASTGEA